jgi:rhodanese-related sulfurtransferase
MGVRWVRAAAIVLAGTVLGLAWNAFSGRGFALTRNVLIKEGDEVISAAEAKARLDRGAVFLDARPVDFYKMSHVPGALPLPEDDFGAHFARIEKRLRSASDIVVYCSGYGCEASHNVARKLRDLGIPAAILHDGMPAWTEAGYPVREGEQP